MPSQKKSRQLRKHRNPEREAQIAQAKHEMNAKLSALAAEYEPRFQSIERVYQAARRDIYAEFQARKQMIEQATLLGGKK
jgi:hypothetical protein